MMMTRIIPGNPEDTSLLCVASVRRRALSAVCLPSSLRELVDVRVKAARGLVMGNART